LGFSRQYWAYTPKAISQTIHAEEQTASITWTATARSRVALAFYHRGVSPKLLAPTLRIFSPESETAVGTLSQDLCCASRVMAKNRSFTAPPLTPKLNALRNAGNDLTDTLFKDARRRQ
jgi:hypothetical protein